MHATGILNLPTKSTIVKKKLLYYKYVKIILDIGLPA